MTSSFWPASICVLLASCAGFGQNDSISRGRYLVEEVAKCQNCHTPRLADGRQDRSRWLKGTLLDFQPIRPMPPWRALAPDITPAGRIFQKWGQKGITDFLKTGTDPYGAEAGPPMPEYKLKAGGAGAIVQCLKSLE